MNIKLNNLLLIIFTSIILFIFIKSSYIVVFEEITVKNQKFGILMFVSFAVLSITMIVMWDDLKKIQINLNIFKRFKL